jgi:hypothetical protein
MICDLPWHLRTVEGDKHVKNAVTKQKLILHIILIFLYDRVPRYYKSVAAFSSPGTSLAILGFGASVH